ncbi:protein TIC 100 [Asparagus officinalis]|nr:protein TIC 100 [Asparagus officinalis]
MEGHGVVEVEIPGVEPVPGSKLEAKMRAEGRIIARDFMSPEDKKWLEMDIEDSVLLAGNLKEFPFYEREGWLKVFGHKPEKGRYRYAGQWKHGRMHGCGVYEVNERIIYGRFYFGEHLEDSTGCDSDVSALHAGIAEVAAAKARMFINKPDGMIREERGPYGDPQHPYFYEEDDVWMAPGFVSQFYEVPDYWKTYVQEVDQEREMWLNSFYKAPLRIPMPAELEYWWSKDDGPEFVLINKEPEPDPEDPTKLIYTEDPLIVHTPTGRLINFVEDEEHGVRLFWQPHLEEGEDVDPEKAEFLPLGFDEFYGRAEPGAKKESTLGSMISSLENKLNPLFERLDNWIEEKKKAREMNKELVEKELEFIEAEICLEEALEDMENELKLKQKEEEKRVVPEKDSDRVSAEGGEDEADSEDEDEDEGAPTSFGTVGQNEGEDKPGKTPFSSLSMSLASHNLVPTIPPKLQESFISWKESRKLCTDIFSPQKIENLSGHAQQNIGMVKFSCSHVPRANMRAAVRGKLGRRKRNNNGYQQLNSLARLLSSQQACEASQLNLSKEYDAYDKNLSILSMHVPVTEIFTVS